MRKQWTEEVKQAAFEYRAKYLGMNNDRRRAELTADKIRFQIWTWEAIRELKGWVDVKDILGNPKADPTGAEARRTRRFLHQLRAAGFIEMRVRYVTPLVRALQFRVVPKTQGRLD